MKNRDLITALSKLPADAEVKVWMPGRRISLTVAFENNGDVLIEGYIDKEEVRA